MRVFIVTEGGSGIGFGHITRCISLYQAFEERNITPEIIVNGDDTAVDLFKNKNYRIFNWLKQTNKLFEIISNAEIAIIDSYLADISFYKNVSKLVKMPVYIDDTKRLDYPKGIVVNGSIYAEEMDYLQKEGITYLLGTKYMPLRKEFWNVPEKIVKEIVESVMITFGGCDAKNMAPKILNFLNKEFPELIKNVIISVGYQNITIRKIEDLNDDNTNLIYYPDSGKMKEVMLESDIAISAGGQTLYELARVGVPTIGICIAENQLNNLKGWKKAGFVECTEWYQDEYFFSKLLKNLNTISSYDIRIERSKAGRDLIDGEGAKRISEILFN